MKEQGEIIIGIRKSQLSTAQADDFQHKLIQASDVYNNESVYIKYIKTSGDIHNTHRLDQLGGKGLFVKEIEDQILSGDIHIGIHSLKDLPAQETKGLRIACWLERLSPNDVLLSNSNLSLKDLPTGSVVGTSSIRRRSQILSFRKDLNIKLLRGNVDTRIQKMENGEYDAIVLSYAGLIRLQKDHLVSDLFPIDEFLPASCQGAVGIQIANKNEDSELLHSLSKMNHQHTELTCSSEREVLKTINANCNSPVSVYAAIKEKKISIQCQLYDHNGSLLFNEFIEGEMKNNLKLGKELGKKIIDQIGQEKINELDILNDDFDYTPKG
tara:strand:+ start:2683 stop:3660 length:978 start_codon:yes stop_codon:yes gene_type:complete